MFDVIIIGAGVVGCAIARELSKYELKVAVLEKEEEIACGASKANSGIVHAGYDAKPGSLKAKLNVQGNMMFDTLSAELDIPFKRIGSLVLAFSEADKVILEELRLRGEKNSVPGLRIVDKDELLAMEPQVSEDAVAALYAPTAGIVGSYEMTIAFAEHAAVNGVSFILNSEVDKIEKEARYFKICTGSKVYLAKYLINSAGVHSDDIAQMAEGSKNFRVLPRAGEYCLLDKYARDRAGHTLFQVPGKMGKGILITPTVEGNILLGPTARDIDDKDCTDCTITGYEEVISKARHSVPSLNTGYIITSFAGLRAHLEIAAYEDNIEDDFYIAHSREVSNLINIIGIESPGLSSAPAIPSLVIDLLKECGCEFEEKSVYNPKRPKLIRFSHMTTEEEQKWVEQNPSYGNVICRCETITEGEIVDAIRRPVGARTLDGIKRRVRAGSGRCQGGFCGPKVLEILSQELSISPLNVTKKGKGSEILVGENKKLDRGV